MNVVIFVWGHVNPKVTFNLFSESFTEQFVVEISFWNSQWIYEKYN